MGDVLAVPRLRVLVVDDAAFVYDYLASLIAELKAPYELEWKSSASAGLEALLGADAYDVCLVDYHLGDGNGLDFLRRAVAAQARTPIVMLTGQGTLELDVEAMNAGAADYLVKGEFSARYFERVLRYVVERNRTLEKVRESEERYALAMQGANDGIWDWRVGDDACHLSRRWKAVLGYTEDELPSTLDTWFLRVHRDDLPKLKQAFQAHIAGETSQLENEHRLRHQDGQWRHVLVRGQAMRDRVGKASRVAGSLTDVTTSRARDPLTGLPNRLLYLDRLDLVFQRAKRDPNSTFAVLFVDLDRFKNVNDSLGHAAGDDLLVEFAKRLERCVRLVDTVARMGGDEFTILLDDPREPDGAIRVAERIVEDLTKPFRLEGRDVYSGASIGIALSHSNYVRPDELLRDADTAMYRAKANGRGNYVLFDPSMHERAVKVLSVESGLRQAITDSQLEVHYQPVIDVGRRTVIGFEALVRWRHPARGLISPAEFIPIAEDSGLIILLDGHVMKRAAHQLAEWGKQFPAAKLFVSVNASRRQFVRERFSRDVEEILNETGLAPDQLHLEVTETVTMDPSPMVSEQFQKLEKMGVKLLVDDFGIGYSSLSLLQKFSFSGIKIDRSFVSRLDSSAQAAELVRAILAMAGAFNLDVTAEGVETEAQYAQLQLLGCEKAQGYLFSRPVPADAATALIAQESAEDGGGAGSPS
jgi:diguanylate cyclase (GGDEF)-like protein/PAS domain S-box-containing protein